MQSPDVREWLGWIRRMGWWRPEVPVLLAVMSVATLTWAFIELADEVTGGDTHAFDHWVVDVLRNPEDPRLPRGPSWLVDATRDITSLGSWPVLFLVVSVAAGYLLLTRRIRAAVLLVAAVVSGVFLSSFLKAYFDRPRPPTGSALQDTLTASFPSGHSLGSAVVYLTLGAMLARFTPGHRLRLYFIGVALFLPLLVGASRVYLGVHYPTDVLAGWAAGAAWALLWWVVTRYAWPGDSSPLIEPPDKADRHQG